MGVSFTTLMPRCFLFCLVLPVDCILLAELGEEVLAVVEELLLLLDPLSLEDLLDFGHLNSPDHQEDLLGELVFAVALRLVPVASTLLCKSEGRLVVRVAPPLVVGRVVSPTLAMSMEDSSRKAAENSLVKVLS